MKRTAKNSSFSQLLDEAAARRAPSSDPAVARYHYRTPPGKRVACNIRIPGSLKGDLGAVARLWQLMAVNEGHNASAIDVTFVCERFLRVGNDGVWAQVKAITGHEGPPKSEGSWDKIRESLQGRRE